MMLSGSLGGGGGGGGRAPVMLSAIFRGCTSDVERSSRGERGYQ